MGVLDQEHDLSRGTVTQCWGCKRWKPCEQHTALNKCVRKVCNSDVQNNSVRKTAKNSAKKWSKKSPKLSKKNLWQHCEKCAKKLWKIFSAGTAGRTIFECEKNLTDFSLFSDQAVSSPLLEGGGVCDSWGSFPSHPGWGTSMYMCSWIFSASPAPPCHWLFLINRGVVVENLDFMPLLACLTKVSKIHICFSRRASADPPPHNNDSQHRSMACHLSSHVLVATSIRSHTRWCKLTKNRKTHLKNCLKQASPPDSENNQHSEGLDSCIESSLSAWLLKADKHQLVSSRCSRLLSLNHMAMCSLCGLFMCHGPLLSVFPSSCYQHAQSHPMM